VKTWVPSSATACASLRMALRMMVDEEWVVDMVCEYCGIWVGVCDVVGRKIKCEWRSGIKIMNFVLKVVFEYTMQRWPNLYNR
jgi:hypothetical protein